MIRVRTILSYAGMTIVIGLLAQQMVTTYYLARIDTGLNSSLHSTAQLASVESAIIDKNQALHDVVKATQAMDGQLGETLQTTQLIDGHIHRIDELNGSVLNINQTLVSLGKQGSQTLTHTAGNLQQLTQAIQQLKTDLTSLETTIATDASNLHDMKAQTDTMNRKVPGVTK